MEYLGIKLVSATFNVEREIVIPRKFKRLIRLRIMKSSVIVTLVTATAVSALSGQATTTVCHHFL